MTRFARAKGSKASNERVPEAATPWAQLKLTALQDQMNPEAEEDQKYATNDHQQVRVNIESEDEIAANSDSSSNDSGVEDEEQEEQSSPPVLLDAEEERKKAKAKKKNARSKSKCLQCKEVGHWKKDCPQLSEERRKELTELEIMKRERKGMGTGRKKNKRRDREQETTKSMPPIIGSGHKVQKKKAKEQKNVKPRKDKAGAVIQEGEGLFQGFRVRLEDVKRLKELQKTLSSKEGVTASEVDEAMKKERRRAEKDLARSKKNVCFHCRKPGHILADCPDGSALEGSNQNMCFKCGSSDHTSKNCTNSKRKGEDAYAFATCFICKEKGHLAKACPDNPKGLYPKGGGCRFCGSVEHLKSDCPRKKNKDERDEIRLGVASSSVGLEDIDPEVVTEGQRKRKQQESASSSMKKKKAIVMF